MKTFTSTEIQWILHVMEAEASRLDAMTGLAAATDMERALCVHTRDNYRNVCQKLQEAIERKDKRKLYRRKLLKQRLTALGLLACCAVMLWMCSTGATMADRDATAVVLLAPLALYMLFSKEIVIF